MSTIFDRDNCTTSVHLQLQVTSLMLLRTTCSFHGNEERLVVEWAVFEQVTVDKVIDHSCSKTAHTDSRPV